MTIARFPKHFAGIRGYLSCALDGRAPALPAPPPMTVATLRAAALHRPASASRIGDAIWVAFVLAQAADGVLTYVGVYTFGPSIEANPLLAWCMAASGAALALVGAKVLALGCGTLLHIQGMHRSIVLLTTVYAGAAIWRWVTVLWPGLF